MLSILLLTVIYVHITRSAYTNLLSVPLTLLAVNLFAAVLVHPVFREHVPLMLFHVALLCMIVLFAFVVVRSIQIGAHAERRGRLYHAYLAYGIGLLIGLQAFVNIGVNMGLLPTKGLTLPLMSYGGSSLLVNCLSVGLLLRIDHELRTRR